MTDDKTMYEDEFEEDDVDYMDDMYLTFGVNERAFGVDIRDVVEIVVLPLITAIPDMPGFVRGIINLRGKVIPLIDLRDRFFIEAAEYSERTCVIIIESNQMLIGLIVDNVSEVLKILKDQMDQAPKIGETHSSRFVEKIGKVGDDIKIILNLDRLLNEEEKSQMNEIKKEEVALAS